LFHIFNVTFMALEDKKAKTYEKEIEIKSNHKSVVDTVAKLIKVNPDHVRLSGKQWKPNPVPKENDKVLLKEMLSVREGPYPPILYYEVFEFPVKRLLSMVTLKLKWRDSRTDVSPHNVVLYLDKNEAKVTNALTAFFEKHKIDVKPNQNTQYRMLAVKNHRIYNEFLSGVDLSKEDIQDYELFIEEIPEEEKLFLSNSEKSKSPDAISKSKSDLSSKSKTELAYKTKSEQLSSKSKPEYHNNDQRIQCVHIEPYGYSYSHYSLELTFTGEPFFFVFKKGEPLREVTERIRQKLEVDKSEFKTWNFYKINASKPGREKKKRTHY